MPTPREFETFAGYTKELAEVEVKLHNNSNPSWELVHRKKILIEWIENEQNKWENTKDSE